VKIENIPETKTQQGKMQGPDKLFNEQLHQLMPFYCNLKAKKLLFFLF
jgi:hypothetical protein